MRRFFLLLLCVVFAGVMSCHKEKPETDELLGEEKEAPDQEGWNSKVTATRNGRLEAVVEYGHMARYSKQKRVFFDEGVAVDFYDAYGRPRSRVTASTGELYEATNDIIAIGHVVVHSDTGVTVWTERLGYRQASGKIYSEVDVMLVTDKGDTLYGTGFESDTQLRQWEIKRPRGTAHSGLDLSPEQLRKRPAPSDTAAAGTLPTGNQP